VAAAARLFIKAVIRVAPVARVVDHLDRAGHLADQLRVAVARNLLAALRVRLMMAIVQIQLQEPHLLGVMVAVLGQVIGRAVARVVADITAGVAVLVVALLLALAAAVLVILVG
jgi:hypothetical protein